MPPRVYTANRVVSWGFLRLVCEACNNRLVVMSSSIDFVDAVREGCDGRTLICPVCSLEYRSKEAYQYDRDTHSSGLRDPWEASEPVVRNARALIRFGKPYCAYNHHPRRLALVAGTVGLPLAMASCKVCGLVYIQRPDKSFTSRLNRLGVGDDSAGFHSGVADQL